MSNIASDPAGWNLASYHHHPMDDMEPLEDQDPMEEYKLALEFSARILHLVNQSEDPKRTTYELFFAIGRDAELGITETQIAKRYGISKQAFSKGVGECRKLLGLPSLQRSEKARATYRLTHKRWHGQTHSPSVLRSN